MQREIFASSIVLISVVFGRLRERSVVLDGVQCPLGNLVVDWCTIKIHRKSGWGIQLGGFPCPTQKPTILCQLMQLRKIRQLLVLVFEDCHGPLSRIGLFSVNYASRTSCSGAIGMVSPFSPTTSAVKRMCDVLTKNKKEKVQEGTLVSLNMIWGR